VFAAWDLRLERMVALKVLKRNVFESRDAVLNEARAAAKLNHPHVCTIYAVDEIDGLPVIVMEHLDGHPLTQDMEDGLPPDRALKFASQIARGLAAAHEQNVVHGDLKPANVIVTARNSAKILDFGLARSQQAATSPTGENRVDHLPSGPPIAWEAGSEDETMVMDTDAASMVAEQDGAAEPAADGTFIRGTPAYMSPEQAGGLRTAPASDIFSLGLMLFEMLSGRRVHGDESPFAMMLRVRTTDMAAELAPQVDAAHRELLATMLARSAADRPAASQVADRLAAT
jgi:serine/threonine protein kinase